MTYSSNNKVTWSEFYIDYIWKNKANPIEDTDSPLKRSAICWERIYKNSEYSDSTTIYIKKTKDYPDPYDKWDERLKINFLSDSYRIYEENMNDIYKCSVINIQKNAISKYLLNIKNIWLVNNIPIFTDRVTMQDRLERIWNSLLRSIEREEAKLECQNLSNIKIKWEYIWDQISELVLARVTNETCIYNFYLEYLKEYYKDAENLFLIHKGSDESWVQFDNLLDTSEKILREIDIIKNRVNRAFPIAFQSYLDYETYFWIHLLLRVIREDYIVMRNKMYESLSPINQVVYKIFNAMKAP